MGGASTKADGVHFEDREEYAKWPLVAVQAAYAKLLKTRSETEQCADMSLTKREFWETFTDYSTISNGQFLNLPMAQYALFDPEDKQSVFALEVFSALIFFCNGELPDKLTFIFVLFDFDKSNGISRDEMVMMLRCVTRALYRVGMTTSFPEYTELETLADEMFNEANGGKDREANVDEILVWATNHMEANDILLRFQENPQSSLKGIDRKKSMAKYHELHDAEPADVKTEGTGNGNEKEKEAKRSTKDIVPDHLLGHMRRQVSRANRLANGRVLHRVTTAQLGAGLRPDRKNMLERIATKTCIRDLTLNTQFTLSEVKRMRGDFAKFAGDDATLSRESFAEILTIRFPKLKENSSLERMYGVFDADGSGSIDFQEFCMGLTRLLKGSADEKLQLLFELYDKNGDGTIGLTELLDIVSETDKTLASEAQFAAQIMHSLDVDGDGSITQDEFVEVLEKEPALMANFSRRISQRTLGSLTNHRTLMTLDEGNQGFTYEGIIALVKELGNDESWNTTHADHTVTEWEFKTMMREHFDTSESSVKFFGRLYAMLDSHTEKKDFVDLRDLLNALVQTLNTTEAQKAAFYFNLYDFDGSGSMDADELLRIVLEGQQKTGADAQIFLEMLKKFDKNGDNSIDCEEFRAAILGNPDLLETFGLLFNATGTTAVIQEATENFVEEDAARKLKEAENSSSSSLAAMALAPADEVVVEGAAGTEGNGTASTLETVPVA